MSRTKFITILSFFAALNFIAAQPKSNLDLIYELIENNVQKLVSELPHEIEPLQFEYSSPPEYQSFENRFIYHLNEMGYLSELKDTPELKYSLDQIGVLYSEPFRDGLLGDYKIERRVFLNGTFTLGTGNRVIKTNIVESTYRDTVFYSEIDAIESRNLTVTQGTKPPEPLFESLLEPVIAVGAVVVSIILLFTVRSK